MTQITLTFYGTVLELRSKIEEVLKTHFKEESCDDNIEDLLRWLTKVDGLPEYIFKSIDFEEKINTEYYLWSKISEVKLSQIINDSIEGSWEFEFEDSSFGGMCSNGLFWLKNFNKLLNLIDTIPKEILVIPFDNITTIPVSWKR